MNHPFDSASVDLDMVIRGGRVVTETDEAICDVGITGEKIAAIAAPGVLRARRYVDAAGLVVMPGGIDTHSHIEWPLEDGSHALDNFETGTGLAALSGTTLVIDFVPSEGERLIDAADRRLEQAQLAAVDYSLHPVIPRVDHEVLADVVTLVNRGMASFKIYTTDERLDDADLRTIMETIGAAGGLVGFHAENRAILAQALAKVKRASGPVLARFAESRPESAESAMISLVTHYARELACPVFVHHVSGAVALAAVEAARQLGTAVRAETCTHYLVFDESVYTSGAAWKFVITPPLRTRSSQAVLWRALREESISCVASDHCAYSVAQKHPGFDDFTAMPAGAPGLAARMPVLWACGVVRGELSLRQFVEITATQPARTFGLYPRKGVVRLGSDADLVLWDPIAAWRWPIWTDLGGSDYDLYEGFSGSGMPRLTIVRGRVVAQDGRIVGSANGTFVPQRIDTTLWH